MKLKALTFTDIETISFETIADPEILDPLDVIVKVTHCSICGSDLHVFYGREKGIEPHTAMGHEFVGEIVEVGKGVSHLQIGDNVMSPFTINCGHCYFCRIGLTARCEKSQLFGWIEKGKGLHGGQAQYVRVPLAESTLQKIPDDVSEEEALLLGDVLSTGYFCAHQAEIKPANTYAVVGCGPVGLMAICGALAQGAEKVFAIDSVDARLQIAKTFGAIPISSEDTDITKKILEFTFGIGIDAVMDAVGSGPASRLAYDIVRPGGIMSVVGVCNDANFSFSPVEAYNKNITYKVGRCPARFYMNKLIPVVRQKKFPLTSVFTHRLKFKEGVLAYDVFANKKDGCVKIVLEC